MKKHKAILVVSFGTTYEETRRLTIERIERNIGERFKEYDVKRAFTSHMIINILKNRDNLIVDTPEEALEKIREEGYKEVVVQSLHIMPGEEYEYVEKVVNSYRQYFESIKLGRPILHFKGDGEELADDYSIAVEALKNQIPKDKAIVFMGHGTPHPANASYSCLEMVFKDNNINNVYIGTVEGYPTIEDIIKRIKRDKVKEVILMPLMLVAGDHCMNDMASDKEDSWKSLLLKEGIKVNLFLHGIGENEKISEIFIKHIEDAIVERYSSIGKTKKGR